MKAKNIEINMTKTNNFTISYRNELMFLNSSIISVYVFFFLFFYSTISSRISFSGSSPKIALMASLGAVSALVL